MENKGVIITVAISAILLFAFYWRYMDIYPDS